MAKIVLNVELNTKGAQSGLDLLKKSLSKVTATLNQMKPDKDLTAQIKALSEYYNSLAAAAKSAAEADEKAATYAAKVTKAEEDAAKATAQRQKAETDAAAAVARRAAAEARAFDTIEKTKAAMEKRAKAAEEDEKALWNLEKAFASLSKRQEEAASKTNVMDQALRDVAEETEETWKEIRAFNESGEALSSTVDELRERYERLAAQTASYEKELNGQAKAEIEAARASEQLVESYQKSEENLDSLRIKLNNMLAAISNVENRYPAGTFDQLKNDIKAQISAIDELKESVSSSGGNMQEFIDKEQAAGQSAKELSGRFAELKANTDKLDDSADRAAKEAEKLKTAYYGMQSTISNLEKQYPAGTFDSIKTSIANALTALNALDRSSDNYVDDVQRMKTEHGQLAQALAKTKAETDKLDSSIDKAEKTAQTMKTQLYNMLTTISNIENRYPSGTFDQLKADIQAQIEGLNNLNREDENYVGKVEDAGKRTDEFRGTLSQLRAETEHAAPAVATLGEKFGNLVERYAKFYASSLLVRKPLQLIQSALSDVGETLVKTEDAVIELNRVLDDPQPTQEVANRLYDIAYAYGSTFENASTIASNFARSGRSWNESLQATEAALLAMNVAELNATEASDGLLSIIAQFDMKTSDLIDVVDKLNKTADKNPVSTQKLLQAIQRAGSAAKNANVSFDQTLGLITAISEATNRSGQNIGTAVNSLIQYSTKNVDVFATLSKESEEMVEKFKLGLVSIVDVWNQVAKDIHNDKEARDNIITALGTDDLEELSSTLHDELGDLVSEIDGVYNVANTYRKNYFIALLDNMDRYMKVQEQLTDYQGYSQEENEKYMETYTAKVNQLNDAWQKLANDEQGILGFKKLLVDIGIGAVDLVDNMGGIVIATTEIGTGIALVTSLFKAGDFAKKVLEIKANLMGVAAETVATTTAVQGLSTAFSYLSIGAAVLVGLITLVAAYNRSMEQARQKTIETAKAHEEDAKQLKTLSDRYKELSPDSEEYREIEDQIVALLGDKAKLLPSVTKGTDDYRKAVENLTEAQLAQYQIEQELAKKAAEESLLADATSFSLWFTPEAKFYRGAVSNSSARAVDELTPQQILAYYDELINKQTELSIKWKELEAAGDFSGAERVSKQYEDIGQQIGAVSEKVEAYKSTIESARETEKILAEGSPIGLHIWEVDKAVEETGKAAEKATERLNKYDDAIEYYLDISNEIKERGIDVSQTIFGNIDTNNRQVLEWTEQNIERFRSALESWGMTARKIEELSGELSTVFGASEWFGSEENGMEIAFSPILQTPDGPVLLEADTVRAYIEGILEEAGENPTKEKILRLDTQGIEQDGMVIRNLIAGIGDEAIKVGEAMHYSGTDGAFAQAFEGLKQHAEELGVSVEDLVQQYNLISREEIYGTFDKIAESEQNLTTVTKDLSTQIDDVQNALSVLDAVQAEYDETGSLSIDTLQKLLELGGEYLDLIIDEEGQIRLNQGAVDDLVAAKQTLLEKLIEEQTVQYAVTLIHEKMAETEEAVGTQAENAAKRVALMVSQVRELAGDSQGATLAMEGLKTALAQLGAMEGVSLTEADLDEIAGKTMTYNQGLRNLLANAVNTSSSGWRSSSGSSSSSSSSSKSTKDEYLEDLKAVVSLRESELTLMEHQGASQDEQIAKIHQIQEAIHTEADYLRSIGASQEDINKLSSDWWKWQEKIVSMQEKSAEAAKKAAEEAKKAAEEAEKAETARLKQVIADDKARLTLMEKQGKSVSDRVEKMKEIQTHLHDEAEWLRKIGAEQSEIDALSAEWWDWQEKILKLYKETLEAARDIELEAQQKVIDGILAEIKAEEEALELSEKQLAIDEKRADLKKAIAKAKLDYVQSVLSDYITALDDAETLESKQRAVAEAREKLVTAEREARSKAIIDAFKAEKDVKSDTLSLEEKRLAVEKARQALIDAENNRTTRVYNESTGQWEYQADAKAVQSAKDNLTKAVDALNAYVEEQAWKEVSEAVENGSVSEAEVLEILSKWAKEAYGNGSPEFVAKIQAAFRKAMGTAASPDSVSGQISAVDNAVKSLNDYLKAEAVKELKAYIAAGNTDASGMRSILDRWLSMGEGAELYQWRDGLLDSVNGAIESGYYDDTKVQSQIRAVENAVTSLHEYLRNRFIREIEDLVKNGTAEEIRAAIEKWSEMEDFDLAPSDLDWATRAADAVEQKENTQSMWDKAMAGDKSSGTINWVLDRMRQNSADWWDADKAGDSAEKKRLSDENYTLGTMMGWHRKDNGHWYDQYDRQVYDKGGVLHGKGGIKATNKPEIILDPELTAKILRPGSEAQFRAFADAMHLMFERGGRTRAEMPVIRNPSVTDSHNTSYVVNGIPISSGSAERYTIAELFRMLPMARS